VAVGTCNGEVAVLNFSSGGVLYNLPHQDREITCLKFLSGLGEFWLVAGTWGGKLILWTEPNEDNNFQITAKCRIGHRGDVLVLDSAFN
jgi:WD40 repeat protein